MTTLKKQVSFYADEDVAELLSRVEPGIKTKLINEAIRATYLAKREGVLSPAIARGRLFGGLSPLASALQEAEEGVFTPVQELRIRQLIREVLQEKDVKD